MAVTDTAGRKAERASELAGEARARASDLVEEARERLADRLEDLTASLERANERLGEALEARLARARPLPEPPPSRRWLPPVGFALLGILIGFLVGRWTARRADEEDLWLEPEGVAEAAGNEPAPATSASDARIEAVHRS